MSVSNLVFTKDWENATDFPTVETSETQVRKDLQLLHNEAKAKINEIILVLNALAGGGVYVATVDTTTIADLVTAANSGESLFALDSGTLYYGVSHTESEGTHTFAFFTIDGTVVKFKTAVGTTSGTTTWSAGTSYDLAGLATLASPALTGVPTAPSAEVGTDTTQIATTEFANDEIQDYLNRSTPVDGSTVESLDDGIYRARGEAFFTSETTPTVDGVIAWVVE